MNLKFKDREITGTLRYVLMRLAVLTSIPYRRLSRRWELGMRGEKLTCPDKHPTSPPKKVTGKINWSWVYQSERPITLYLKYRCLDYYQMR